MRIPIPHQLDSDSVSPNSYIVDPIHRGPIRFSATTREPNLHLLMFSCRRCRCRLPVKLKSRRWLRPQRENAWSVGTFPTKSKRTSPEDLHWNDNYELETNSSPFCPIPRQGSITGFDSRASRRFVFQNRALFKPAQRKINTWNCNSIPSEARDRQTDRKETNINNNLNLRRKIDKPIGLGNILYFFTSSDRFNGGGTTKEMTRYGTM